MASLLVAVIYLAFVSLGLPDSLLGSGWPTMRIAFGVPSAYAGYVSMTISGMTILSSLMASMIIRRARTDRIVVISTLMTVFGLLGFSFSSRYWMLFLFAVPYGLGAGTVDAALNNYVAKHYKSSVMNYLHCFYALGAMTSPYVMALALSRARWNEGYRWTAYLQAGIMLIVLLSAPLWKKGPAAEEEKEERNGAGIREAIRIPGVKPTLVSFFAYGAGEISCFLWTSSFFAAKEGVSLELAAAFGSLGLGGLMLGRLLSALVSDRLGDRMLIRLGVGVEFIGIVLIALPFKGYVPAAVGFVVTGLGMAPVYPAIQHMAPGNFGARNSAAIIGMQMACAYTGSTLMPMVFGHIQQAAGIGVLPLYLAIFAVLNIVLIEYAYTRIDNKG